MNYKKYRSWVKNAYLNFTWKVLKSKIGKNCMNDVIKYVANMWKTQEGCKMHN
jgi:hypothetical protein